MVQEVFAGISSGSPCQRETPGPPSPAHGHHGQGCSAEGQAVGSSLQTERGFRAESHVAFQREKKQNSTKAT